MADSASKAVNSLYVASNQKNDIVATGGYSILRATAMITGANNGFRKPIDSGMYAAVCSHYSEASENIISNQLLFSEQPEPLMHVEIQSASEGMHAFSLIGDPRCEEED